MINIDTGSNTPIYIQIYDEIVKMIISGVLSEDDKILSVREMSALIRINPNTVQKAYKLLESEKYIYSVPGKGSFVSRVNKIRITEMEKLKKELNEIIFRMKDYGVEKKEIIDMVKKIIGKEVK